MSEKIETVDMSAQAGSGNGGSSEQAGGNGGNGGGHQTSSRVSVNRHYTKEGCDPYDEIEWKKYTAQIHDEKGVLVFTQKDVEVPSFWSQDTANIVASKYFYGEPGTKERETSARQLVSRVSKTISDWGLQKGYFSEEDAQLFELELRSILINQRAAFNSPVWFNVGCEKTPQCSACFINSVKDSMSSILTLAKLEGMLFKWGSGAGSNLSPLRSSVESLRGGGRASGPVSFMEGFDAFAGVIKSGGRTRRAAKMVILNITHPDVRHFIHCKADEEQKAWALISKGYTGAFNVPGGAYDSVKFQNANHSVRVTDEFMEAVSTGASWSTRKVVGGDIVDTFDARTLLREMAEAVHICGDPGIQYDSTINRWNTCKVSGDINASNPCSEYMFLDDTACNLSSINLMKYYRPNQGFDLAGFCHTARIMTLAKEIIVGCSSYPSEAIERNSHIYRTLGLGFCNLGALLMAWGIPYDSDLGRGFAAIITAVMNGTAYTQSAEIASVLGPFSAFEENRDSMLGVMRMHRAAVEEIPSLASLPQELVVTARDSWDSALRLGQQYGYRNAQISVIAPTGTIAFLMGADTTGIEPSIALVTRKKLVGGGDMRLSASDTVELALKNLGYDDYTRAAIIAHIDSHGTIQGSHLSDEHLPVFDCAFGTGRRGRYISPMGHVNMMAAVQPFVSGAISKTVNVPTHTTPQEIYDLYVQGHKLGLKALAVYRDGSKLSQPVRTAVDNPIAAEIFAPKKDYLPDDRLGLTHKFKIGSHKGYITFGFYDDGRLGEFFLVMAKEGDQLSGFADNWSISLSRELQYGIPLEAVLEKHKGSTFEPKGFTNNKDVHQAKSPVDYVCHVIEQMMFGVPGDRAKRSVAPGDPIPEELIPTYRRRYLQLFPSRVDDVRHNYVPCVDCSYQLDPGTCSSCPNCGSSRTCGGG